MPTRPACRRSGTACGGRGRTQQDGHEQDDAERGPDQLHRGVLAGDRAVDLLRGEVEPVDDRQAEPDEQGDRGQQQRVGVGRELADDEVRHQPQRGDPGAEGPSPGAAAGDREVDDALGDQTVMSTAKPSSASSVPRRLGGVVAGRGARGSVAGPDISRPSGGAPGSGDAVVVLGSSPSPMALGSPRRGRRVGRGRAWPGRHQDPWSAARRVAGGGGAEGQTGSRCRGARRGCGRRPASSAVMPRAHPAARPAG